MVDADHLRPPNPWRPMTRPLDLALLGKLAEELGEAVAAANRCIIQGIEQAEPVTGKPNKAWLADELADVIAGAQLVIKHFHLDTAAMQRRIDNKQMHLRQWHGMLGDD